MKPRKKRGADAPANVKKFISSVTSTPLENIQDPLSGFCWNYEKGDYHHWTDLFQHFDLFFEKYIKPRKDLQLDGDYLEPQEELPEGALFEILRVSRIIFENCANKYLYRSHENLLSLLASTNSVIVIAALQTLAALVKKPAQSTRSVRWHGDSVFNGHLFSLSQGWGGKEEGLGLLSCAVQDGCDADAFQLASTLHYEFYADTLSGEESDSAALCLGLQVIHIPDVYLRPESDLLLFKKLVDQYHVPVKLRFSLFTRLRFARAFHTLQIRRQFICIRLLAFTALLQSNPDHEDLTAFFVNEPEFVNELVALLQSEDAVPEDIRILALRALAAQAQDRPRQSNVLNVVSAGGHRGVLPSLVQKAVVSLTNESGTCSIPFVEALLFLVTVLVSSSAGCAALREAGLIPTLLPLLKDTSPHHIDLVISAAHILEAFMDYSNPAGNLFRDLGGLDDTITRLQYEVTHIDHRAKDEQGEMEVSDSNIMDSSQHEILVPYRHRLLLKALLRAIALGTYASGNTTRLHGSEESALPACLCTIFRHTKEFGGGVFSLAASVMSDLINKDPTCFPTLDAAGLPTAFLDAITAGVLPSSDAVGCIPHALDALCLNHAGLQAVLDSRALECFVKIFTSKSYLKALGGDTPAAIASGLDELMRHAPPLRGPGVDACINILKRIRMIGGVDTPETEDSDIPTPMDMDAEQQAASNHKEEESKAVQIESGSDIGTEAFLPECINNTVQMLETIFQNADTCRAFIEKKGIEDLLKLFTLPLLPVSFGGSPTAFNIFSTFRAFSSQHAGTLAKAVCKALKEHMKKTADSLVSMKFSDIEAASQEKVAKNLSAAQCYLSLVTCLLRTVTLMMTEINTAGNDLFDDIGSIHRWVLWQTSLVDDAKIEPSRDEESASKSAIAIDTEGEIRDNEDEPEAAPVIRYGGGSRSRWGFESDLIPLLPTEQHDRRTRRESMETELWNHVARLDRLARTRNAAVRTVRGDLEANEDKSAETMCYEMMTRLAVAARGFYVTLVVKATAVPSRHRDGYDSMNPVNTTIASFLATLFLKNLEFTGIGGPSSSSSEASVSVKCRYLGKVVEDITAVVIMDSRKRNCNTSMVNHLYAHGTLKELLTTFEATSQLLWTSLPMETEAGNVEVEKGDKLSAESWILETLKNYTKLMEHLVNPATLLVPSSMVQFLVQYVSGRTVPTPKDPEHFVLALQAQVLEIVLPLWNHPMFSQCNPFFIESIVSIIKHIYTDVTDTRVQQTPDVGTTANRQQLSPPDESAISLIVEMGFPRARAEEALRRVGNNRVELAMEWLFGHPEEVVQEEDELARALALSLGSGSDSATEDTSGKGKDTNIEESRPRLLPVNDMLGSSLNLLYRSNTIIFSVADLIVTMCTRNKGEDRQKVISYLIQEVKLLKVEDSMTDDCPLSTVSHLLALILSEDTISREAAAKSGIASIALDFLSSFKPVSVSADKPIVPKWVTSLLLVLDSMLQHRPKLDSTLQNSGGGSVEITADTSKASTEDQKADVDLTHRNSWEAILGKPTGYMTEEEQKRTMAVTCNLLSMPLSSAPAQAILQLSARLTKVHSIAMQFLDNGGLSALLSLPRTCLFTGFDNVAAAIIRHLLEDPQTLQQAMESEIRHALTTSLNRHNNRISPRTFLTTMARIVARDPKIFMQAASALCQIEESGGRLYVVLSKHKEKEKEREKDRGSEKDKEKKGHDENTVGPKIMEGSKSFKGHKKVPQSFSHVMEQLLDIIINFVPQEKISSGFPKISTPTIPTSMEVDEVVVKSKGKAKVDDTEKSEKSSISESSAALAKVSFILKLTTDIILMYSSSSTVVLRRDTETGQGKNIFHTEAVGHGGLLQGILHKLVPNFRSISAEKSPEHELKEKLSSKAVQFLVAVCMRSAEGRRRLFSEISRSLICASSSPDASSQEGSQAPDKEMCAFVDFLNTVLLSHTSSGTGQSPGISTEIAKAMLETDLVQALTTLIQVIDLDHPDAPKLVSGIAKALEALTRAASVGDMTDSKRNLENVTDAENGLIFSNAQPPDIQNIDEMEASLREDLQVAIRRILVHDDMRNDEQLDHDMGLDEVANGDDEEDDDVHLETEDEDFMPDAEVGDVAGATMTFRIDHRDADDLGEDEDDDEDMDDDAGEEEDEDEEDEQDDDELEDEVALSPPDTDAEDPDQHELEEEYDDDMAEEGEEDEDEDEWRENRIIGVRWREGANGFNHIQVLGPTDTANQVDPFQGMNIDYLFGAFRRPGGLDRRRGSSYRTFDRTGTEITRSSRHPLLNRPNVPGSGGFSVSSPWASTGVLVGQEAEAVLNDGLDVSQLYTWYDSTMVDHVGDGLFGDRGVGGQDVFLDFPMLPRVGRRGSRADGQFSSWTDDGQLQGGAIDVALAQAFEEQFLSQFSSPTSGAQPSSGPVADGHTSDLVDMAPRAPELSIGREEADTPSLAHEHRQENPNNPLVNLSEDAQQNEGSSYTALNVGGGLNDQLPNAGLDVHMHDQRTGSAVKDIEATSQDSNGSGATVGESLRSLEVEIGSADGHDESDRAAVSDRIDAGHPSREIANMTRADGRTREVSVQRGEAQTVGVALEDRSDQPSAVDNSRPMESGSAEHAEDRGESLQGEQTDISRNSIDPTFLEALPEDLRAEVLASQQTQPTRTEEHQPSSVQDIDPEFLAALPPEIQAEVLAQQQAQRIIQAHHLEGQPVDMDSASIIATFPAELREEVLLTSSESVLAALPPALLAEARLLRERAMSQLQSRNIFGLSHRLGGRRNIMDIGSRGISDAIDRAVGSGLSSEPGRRTTSGIVASGNKENLEEGKALVDTSALKAILRLLRLAQPLGKGILQRLLYNLCSHSLTCATLVQLLLDMLRPNGARDSTNGLSADGAPPHRLYGCQSNIVYARPQLSDGVPPLVSRRILEILTYLAKHKALVASLLLYSEPIASLERKTEVSEQVVEKGKEKVDDEMMEESSGSNLKGQIPLILLLKLLNQPLYSRSSAHLEQVLGLIEVVTSKACEIVQSHVPEAGVSAIETNQEARERPESSTFELNSENAAGASSGQESEIRSSEDHPDGEHLNTATCTSEKKVDPLTIFLHLPSEELRQLCLLLGREGLSDLAYSRVSEVLNKIADIAPPHRCLFITELADAAQKLSGSAVKELNILSDADSIQISAGLMAGAAILRVLSALSALKALGVAKVGGKDGVLNKEEDECISVIRDLNTNIEPLWQALSTCAIKIESRLITSPSSSPGTALTTLSGGSAAVMPPLSPGTQRLLPFIEGFFILCDKLRSSPASQVNNELLTATACEIKEIASSASTSEATSLQLTKADDKGVTFIRFADKHRRLLNLFVRQNPGLLEKSLSLLLKAPRLIDFDNKRAYFKSRIRHQHEQQHYAPLRIRVRRAYVLEDSYNQLRMRTPDELKGRLTVQFQGEEGIDAGGLTREWYQLLSRVIFDKGTLLFTTVGNESSFQPNPNSAYQTEHLSYFKFVGRVVAKALFDGQLLDVYFTRSFYKHILGVKVTYHDIEAVDPDFYKSLKWVLENVVTDILGLTFSIDADEEKHILYERTEVTDHELIPEGRNIRVTEENKHEYVDLVAEHRLTTAIRPQINAFLEGFNELISRDLISIFNDKELELLISGLPEIDLENLKANTEYTGYTAASPVVQWFWEVVQAFSKEDMARLLQFITGTSKVPLEGFQALQGISGPQKFQIHKAYGPPERLPSAHTCFNQLDIPEYASTEQLRERLLLAIHEGSEGFGFG